VKETFRDKFGRIVGYTFESGNSIIAHDKYGRPVGRYSKDRDVTVDASGRVFGRGNFLSALIAREAGL
jgi:hypothetical protein